MSEEILLTIIIYALVFVISLLVAVLIKVIMGALSLFEKSAVVPEAATSKAPPEPAVSDIPAIAAAVYAVMGMHRIVRIKEGGRGRSWTNEGRIIHQTSHAIQHNPKH